MPKLLVVCIALAAHATAALGQGTGQPPASESTGSARLAGDVYLTLRNGERQRMSGREVHLVPDAAIRAWAPDCAARDSSRKAYLRLRRPARLAYDAAQTSNERRRAQHIARAEAARAAAFAALEPATRLEAEIVARLNTQRATRTGEDGSFVFDGVSPGGHALYVDATPTHLWFVPVTVAPGSQRHELGDANVSQAGSDRASTMAVFLCMHAAMAALPDTGTDVGRRELREVERVPALANREEVVSILRRRQPLLLRDAGVSARVTVRALVRADGTVDPESIEAVETTMDGSPLQGETEAAAELAMESFRFHPALFDGRAVPVWVFLPIEFASSID